MKISEIFLSHRKLQERENKKMSFSEKKKLKTAL